MVHPAKTKKEALCPKLTLHLGEENFSQGTPKEPPLFLRITFTGQWESWIQIIVEIKLKYSLQKFEDRTVQL